MAAKREIDDEPTCPIIIESQLGLGTRRNASWTAAARLVCVLVTVVAGWCAGADSQAQATVAAPTIAVGSDHTCTVLSTGHIDCWGAGGEGQLGDATTDNARMPVEVRGITDATQVTAGFEYTCALLSTGHVDCWGDNSHGQRGDGTFTGPERCATLSYASLDYGCSARPVAVHGITDAIQVTAGASAACALLATGHIDCWGNSQDGQLGDGTDARPKRCTDGDACDTTPVAVRGVSDAIQVAAGDTHACAVLATGQVDCWGENLYDELGTRTNHDSYTPTRAQGITNATQVAAGTGDTCALLATGRIQCWGNYSGQPGAAPKQCRGSYGCNPTLVAVRGIADATQVAAGDNYTCALLATGRVDCWGGNREGQLGDGTNTGSDTPVEVHGITNATQVAAGHAHTCAVLSTRQLYCWGDNGTGQLGNGTGASSDTPMAAQGITDATQVAAGSEHTCALLTTGHIDCWGDDMSGQLGSGTHAQYNTPAEVRGITNATQVAAGSEHTCALLTTGHIDCWGDNSNGQLGNSTNTGPERCTWNHAVIYGCSATPVAVGGIADAIQVAAGRSHTCALLATGHVECWGENAYGQLGDGTNTASDTPVEAKGITNATQVAAGDAHTCAVLATGQLDCWGGDFSSQLGSGTGASNTPVEAQRIAGAIQVAAGVDETCTVLSSGHVDCWGDNYYGQLGNGEEKTSGSTPFEAEGIIDAVQVAAGGSHTCALLATGHIDCSGENFWGQLGDGSHTNSDTPVEVEDIANATQVATGKSYTVALLSTGQIACWGSNNCGNALWSTVPLEVPLGAPPMATRVPPVATAVELRTALKHQLRPCGASASISSLVRRDGCPYRFTAPGAGKLLIDWYYLPMRAHLPASSRAMLVAADSATFYGAGTATLHIKLTKKGVWMFTHRKAIRLIVSGTFAPPGRAAVYASKTCTLTRTRE